MGMKKVISILLSLSFITVLMAGCGSSSGTASSAGSTSSNNTDVLASVSKKDSLAALLPDRVKSAGKITIGLDDSYPPMEYRDEQNKLVGFDIDLGNAIGKKLGVSIDWLPTAWDGILPSLQSKKFDMILSSLSITDERKKSIGFSEPYIQGGPIIITKKGNTSIKSDTDLNGKVVGVQLGSTGEDAAKAVTGIKELKKYDKITEALQDLAAGRTEAVVADDQVGRYYVGLAADQYVVAAKMHDEPFGIGFRKEDQTLNDAVQKAINDLKAEGTLSKISMKWFKTDYYKK
jgi:polar amino acid transport system substrate-binding protein